MEASKIRRCVALSRLELNIVQTQVFFIWSKRNELMTAAFQNLFPRYLLLSENTRSSRFEPFSSPNYIVIMKIFPPNSMKILHILVDLSDINSSRCTKIFILSVRVLVEHVNRFYPF